MRVTIIVLLGILCPLLLSGQYMSHYHEQQLMYGPSLVAESKFYRPRSEQPKRLTYILPSISVTMISPELTYGDLYIEETKTLDLTIATDRAQDFDLLLNGRVSYGGLAYQLNKLRLSFMHEMIADTRLNVPHHIFKLVTEGNASLVNADVDINPQALFVSTHKWSLGADYQFENLMVGLQANLYTGNAFLNTYSSTINIDFEENFFEFGFDKDILVESSGALHYNSLDSIDFKLAENAISPLGSTKNLGFGLSAQFSYQPTDYLRVFGRIEDIGFIKWKNDTQIFEEQSQERFGGFDIRESYVSGQAYSVEDTLFSKLEVEARNEAFTSSVMNSFLIGAQYDINDYFSSGLLLRSKNNGVGQIFFLEPYLTFSPKEHTYITLANFMQKDALINPKVTLHTELANTFGFNVSLVNPWQIGRYYDSKMIYASLGMYVKFLRRE